MTSTTARRIFWKGWLIGAAADRIFVRLKAWSEIATTDPAIVRGKDRTTFAARSSVFGKNRSALHNNKVNRFT
jgi:hypothetical protein